MLEDNVNMAFGKKPQHDERFLNLGQMDSATCAALNGTQNENRQCMVNTVQHPDDPDTLIIRKMRYQKPGDGIAPQD